VTTAGLRTCLTCAAAGLRNAGAGGGTAGAGAFWALAVAAKKNASDAVRSRPVSAKAGEYLNFESTELVTKTLT
jgi:hypothetical protein